MTAKKAEAEHKKPGPKGYPWDEWLKAGRKLVLKRPRDFGCKPHGFAQQARTAATKRGIKVAVKVGESEVRLEVSG